MCLHVVEQFDVLQQFVVWLDMFEEKCLRMEPVSSCVFLFRVPAGEVGSLENEIRALKHANEEKQTQLNQLQKKNSALEVCGFLFSMAES